MSKARSLKNFLIPILSEIKSHGFWTGLGALTLVLSMASVGFFSKHFVRIKVGPFFVLEAVVLFVFAVVLLSKSNRRIFTSELRSKFSGTGSLLVNPLFLGGLFLVFGCLRLFYDLTFKFTHENSLQQTLQHSIIFIYPMVWILLGMWLSKAYNRLTSFCFILVAVLNFPSYLLFTGKNVSLTDPLMHQIAPNLATGAISLVIAYYVLIKTKNILLSLPLFLFSFFPIWMMVHTYVHRISILHMMVLIFAIPILFHIHKKNRLKKSFVHGMAVFSLLVVGYFISVTVSAHNETATKPFSNSLVRSLQHGDDFPRSGQDLEIVNVNQNTFLFSSRRFWWSKAIEEWHKKPILGTGMIPFVPSHIIPAMGRYPAFKNDGKDGGDGIWFSAGRRPISGPHNSYLTVLTRLGVVGLGIFLVFLFSLSACIWIELSSNLLRLNASLLSRVIAYCLFINSLIYALVAVGFESPHNAVLGWFAAGTLLNPNALAEYLSLKRQPALSFYKTEKIN